MAEAGLRGIARESVGWSIGLSVVMIVVGLVALAAPLAAGVAVTGVVAWGLLLLGVLHLWFAWHTRAAGALIWELLIGGAYLFAGIFILTHPLAGLVTLTLLLGSYLLIKGVVEIIGGFSTRGVPGGGWLLIDGVVSLILSAMIWFHLPSTAVWVIGTLIGFSILFSGLSRLFLSLAARRVLLRA
ncbi:MAG: DUF308 domain-containing protein [Acidobacteriaceae bacterium]|nr:DUF308 domain-containing protein [Acidobacteriaceae bacterium]